MPGKGKGFSPCEDPRHLIPVAGMGQGESGEGGFMLEENASCRPAGRQIPHLLAQSHRDTAGPLLVNRVPKGLSLSPVQPPTCVPPRVCPAKGVPSPVAGSVLAHLAPSRPQGLGSGLGWEDYRELSQATSQAGARGDRCKREHARGHPQRACTSVCPWPAEWQFDGWSNVT